MVLPTSSPGRVAFSGDLLDQKSKSLLFPGPGGRGGGGVGLVHKK